MPRSHVLAAIVLSLVGTMQAARAEALRVGVAISLKEAVTEIAEMYEDETGDKVELTFGSSGQLAAQIEAGAPIDAFISAANKQVDDLAKGKLVEADSRRMIAGNALVLIVPADAKDTPQTFGELAQPAVKRVAVGEPKTVPAGQYASQVFEALKLGDSLRPKLVYGTNVRQVLLYVERGEVSAGVVYATDARESGDRVRVMAKADPKHHEPIIYPAVVVSGSAKREAAGRFLSFLTGPKAQAVLRARGFSPPPPPTDDADGPTTGSR